MLSTDYVETHVLSAKNRNMDDWMTKLVIAIVMICGVISSFCAGAQWARMQVAEEYMHRTRELLDAATLTPKHERDADQEPQRYQRSRDAGQVSSL